MSAEEDIRQRHRQIEDQVTDYIDHLLKSGYDVTFDDLDRIASREPIVAPQIKLNLKRLAEAKVAIEQGMVTSETTSDLADAAQNLALIVHSVPSQEFSEKLKKLKKSRYF